MCTVDQPKAAPQLSVLDGRLAVCRFGPDHEVPHWALESWFFSVTRTPEELSIICPEPNVPGGLVCERGWRAMKLEGPLEFSMVGVLASVAGPLAAAGVSIFTVSTYDTDYVMVKEEQLDLAVDALRTYGHEIARP